MGIGSVVLVAAQAELPNPRLMDRQLRDAAR